MTAEIEKPNNEWLVAVIKNAKHGALPDTLRSILSDASGTYDDDLFDIESLVDAIELALMTLAGELTAASVRDALRSIAEMIAGTIDQPWEQIADLIFGTLEWGPLKKTHFLDAWGR